MIRTWLGGWLAALLLLATFSPTPARAWDGRTHGVIARIALDEVSPRTRAAVLALLAQAPSMETGRCDASSIDKAASWADCIRFLGDRFSHTANWHYQNVDICRPFDLRTPCRDGNCVSAQIDRSLRLLKAQDVPVRERVAALAFLIHFVGDLHMPLHAGDRRDLGGNRLQSGYGPLPQNLHLIWDGWLAERAVSTPPADEALIGGIAPEERAAMAAGSTEDWSRETWMVAREAAYAAVLDDPCAEEETPRALDPERIAALVPVLRRQVARAGVRLARLLEEAFA